ncbi:MAG: hypothetical protein IPM54_43725 [Polyangiaceae bacterium]|nr:hypothetical protein [Polyangiaceae bacterium]
MSTNIHAWLIAVAVLFAAPVASADLVEDADRLATEWTRRGARTHRPKPVFAEHGQTRILEIEPNVLDAAAPGCITVALLGAPTIDYVATPLRDGMPLDVLPLPDGHPALSLDAESTRSGIGVATLTRCNQERKELARIAVTMRSPRGAIDTVVARAASSLGDAREVLSERVAGVVAPRGNPGRPLEPGPLAERVVRARTASSCQARQSFSRVSVVAMPEGAGQTRLRLSEGCHRISVMAAVPTSFPHQATDVDAEVRDDSGRVLARDRAETADARLDFCVGEPSRVAVVYGGASGAVPVMVTDAAWPLPEAIPNHWGARVRAGFALAFRRRSAPAPTTPAAFESMGSSGPTMIPVSIEPGRCYFAAVSVLRGEPRGMRIHATVGDRFVRDDVIDRPEGAGLAFCSESEGAARIEVDARGSNVFWVFALFPLGGGST